MKSRKITSYERSQLVGVLMRKTFEKRKEALQIKIDRFVTLVYEDFVGPYANSIAALPERAQDKVTRVDIKCNLSYRSLRGQLPEERRYLSNLIPRLDATEHPRWYNRFQKICGYQDELAEKFRHTESQTEGALDQLNTTKQLADNWPEAFTVFLELNPDTVNHLLPAVPRKTLNTLLNLATETDDD